jgi:hypothetical protein
MDNVDNVLPRQIVLLGHLYYVVPFSPLAKFEMIVAKNVCRSPASI